MRSTIVAYICVNNVDI